MATHIRDWEASPKSTVLTSRQVASSGMTARLNLTLAFLASFQSDPAKLVVIRQGFYHPSRVDGLKDHEGRVLGSRRLGRFFL